jgi:hypothetical protein
MINYYLPDYHFNEIHSKNLKAPLDKIYRTLRQLDFSKSWVISGLFKIRGLKTNKMSFDKMIDTDSFFTIYEKENKEWVIGLLADSFKMPTLLKHLENFNDWDPGKGVKIAWNFLLQEMENGNVKVSTETRIQCLSKKAKFFFAVYWVLVRPFSGLIRLEMLRILKNKSEQ